MGECLIARGQTATKNVLDDIPVSGDYCSIVVLLQDSAGGPCENTKINCKDGTRWYNYTTNEAGMVLFKCNSGAANISANNWINGKYTFDQAAASKDYDAPVGTKRLERLSFGKINHFKQINPGWINGQFRGIDYIKDLIMIGGGGGGGCSSGNSSTMRVSGGGGGGGGAKNFLSSIGIVKGEAYNLYVGEAGSGATNQTINGGSGGSTIGFGLSANGGGGGGGFGGAGGVGGRGLFNGGNGGAGMPNRPFGYDNKKGNDGFNGVNGAGGGGGGGGYSRTSGNTTQSAFYSSNGGSIGGGKGSATFMNYRETVATNFGGGGGGSGMDTVYVSQGYGSGYFSCKGGDGYCGKIEFDM